MSQVQPRPKVFAMPLIDGVYKKDEYTVISKQLKNFDDDFQETKDYAKQKSKTDFQSKANHAHSLRKTRQY